MCSWRWVRSCGRRPIVSFPIFFLNVELSQIRLSSGRPMIGLVGLVCFVVFWGGMIAINSPFGGCTGIDMVTVRDRCWLRGIACYRAGVDLPFGVPYDLLV